MITFISSTASITANTNIKITIAKVDPEISIDKIKINNKKTVLFTERYFYTLLKT